jgi:uncharacterized membrane protein YbhN (UPF0104 family)
VGVLDSVAGWLGEVVDQITSISLPILLLGLGLHTCEILLNALAWRNTLRAAYPRGDTRFGSVLGAYAGGVGLNTILPAQAGTVAMLGLYRVQIKGSTVLGLLGAGFVQSLFFALLGALLCIVLVVSRPQSFEIKTVWLQDHAVLGLGGALVIATVLWLLLRRTRQSITNAKEGAAILRTPRRYTSHVLAPQVASYLVRMAVTATFMHAYGVPVSPRAVLLVIAANAISSTFAATPGGIGEQQALAAIALRNYAPSDVVTAYSLGQQLIISAWDVLLGLLLLWSTIGFSATRELLRRKMRAVPDELPAEPAPPPHDDTR